MKTLNVNIPDDLDISEAEVLRFLAAKMYEAGKLSLGHAAQLAGLSKPTFMEILSEYGVSIINYSGEDAIEDSKRI